MPDRAGPPQSGELLDEIRFAQALNAASCAISAPSNTPARPAAAGRAALTGENKRMMASYAFLIPLPQLEMIQRDHDEAVAIFSSATSCGISATGVSSVSKSSPWSNSTPCFSRHFSISTVKWCCSKIAGLEWMRRAAARFQPSYPSPRAFAPAVATIGFVGSIHAAGNFQFQSVEPLAVLPHHHQLLVGVDGDDVHH